MSIFLSFYGRVTSPESAESVPFYWLLSKDSVLIFLRETFTRSWLNWRLSLANVCPELKFLFQFPLTKKMAFWPNRLLANHLPFSFPHYSNQVRMPEWPGFVTLFNRLQVLECKELTFLLLTVKLSACWFKHRGLGEFTSLSLSR